MKKRFVMLFFVFVVSACLLFVQSSFAKEVRETSVAEEILEVLYENGQITKEQYHKLLQKARQEEQRWEKAQQKKEKKFEEIEKQISSVAKAGTTFKKDYGTKELKLKIFGFSQLEARTGDAYAKREDKSDDDLWFGAQRIRLGTKYYYGNVFGKLFLDFNKSHTDKGAGLPEMIKDAFVGYRFNDSLFARLGMIKTPNGLGYTTPGWNLDNIERNKLDKGLVLERDMGLLVSGRYIGFDTPEGSTSGTEMGHEHVGKGFGYDIGVFNPAGRSASVIREGELSSDKKRLGDALTYVGRIHFDWGDPLHFEASYGISEEAGGRGTDDYKVFDAGIDSTLFGQYNLKLEYILGQNIRGVEDDDQSCITGTAAYMINPRLELMAKHYQAFSDPPQGEDMDLGNTYVGFNFYLTDLGIKTQELDRMYRRKLQNNRIQLNYMFTSGDDDDWNGHWGEVDDAILAQYQYKF